MTFQIDKNVPIPTKRSGRISKYPFASMESGDSFFSTSPQYSVSACASRYGKLHKKKFTVAKEGEGVRCWRVS